MPDNDMKEASSGFGSASFGRLVSYAAKTSMVYMLGLAATRLGDFLLVPLYWSLLSPSDYGIIAIAAIFIEFLSAVLGLGLPDSITRFY
jgi:O-antigen/teichoic acid export membrane protein